MKVIEIEKLAKRYRLGTAFDGLTLAERITALFHREPAQARKAVGSLWALRDISFSVNEGEVVGILGRNGAGKSTLLKILSRITPPTDGYARLSGRVASLLEVGAGFHGELTGRENIFLNGVILGMSRETIRRRFDEIVAFAEVERFIDTPVKRYSSGMYVRLAFAVAAHLDSEILLVDEVLAVGDINFQRKCLGKLGEMTGGGRTVLFVSHNITAVRSFCSRVVIIDNGAVVEDGPTDKVLPSYLRLMHGRRTLDNAAVANRLGRTSGRARFTSVSARNDAGVESWNFKTGETIHLDLAFAVKERVENLGLYVSLRALATNETVTTLKEVISGVAVEGGSHQRVELQFPNAALRSGDYALYIALGDSTCEKFHDVIDENVDLPCLSVGSTESDPRLHTGYFTMPAKVIFK